MKYTVDFCKAKLEEKGVICGGDILIPEKFLQEIGNKTWGKIDFLRKSFNCLVKVVERKVDGKKVDDYVMNFGDSNKWKK